MRHLQSQKPEKTAIATPTSTAAPSEEDMTADFQGIWELNGIPVAKLTPESGTIFLGSGATAGPVSGIGGDKVAFDGPGCLLFGQSTSAGIQWENGDVWTKRSRTEGAQGSYEFNGKY